MANVKNLIEKTFQIEGGLSIDNDDKGGFTYLGVAYLKHPKLKVFDSIFPIVIKKLKEYNITKTVTQLKVIGTSKGEKINLTKTQLKEITKELSAKTSITNEIKQFYKTQFWDINSFDDFVSQSLAENVFDFGVNVGPIYAAKKLQKIVGTLVDGKIGPNSIYAINSATISNNFLLNLDFSIVKINHYLNICIKTPTNKKYLHGWLNRTFEIFEEIYTMDDIQKLLKETSADGLIGRNQKGFGAYIGKKNFDKLVKFVKIYELNTNYKQNKNIDILVQGLSSI